MSYPIRVSGMMPTLDEGLTESIVAEAKEYRCIDCGQADPDPLIGLLNGHLVFFCPNCSPVSVATGQIRGNQEGTEEIRIFGCYGSGSGGRLFWVSFPNVSYSSPNGMDEDDIREKYPVVVKPAPV